MANSYSSAQECDARGDAIITNAGKQKSSIVLRQHCFF